MTDVAETSMVTGFPRFVARRLAAKLLERPEENQRVFLLVRKTFIAAANEFLAGLDANTRERLRIVEGDVGDMDLGLAGGEYKALGSELTAIYHLAELQPCDAKREQFERVNVEGTRTVLELATEIPKLRRLIHFSSAHVAGTRTGVILEEELDERQRFYDLFEETKFQAERLVQGAARRLPITILRPSTIVGDSRSGQIDRFDGPYYLLVLIVTSPIDVHLPLPVRGDVPLNLVPIDFVVDAAAALSRDARAQGGTFHLCDPSPFSARSVYRLAALRADRKPPRGVIPTGLARVFLSVPGIERVARAPLSLITALHHFAVYNCRNTLALLENTTVRCPPIDAYIDKLVHYIRQVHAEKRERLEEEAYDPFD